MQTKNLKPTNKQSTKTNKNKHKNLSVMETTKARILLEQINPSKNIERLTIVNLEYTIKNCTAVNVEKLTQSITKAVFRRYKAEKEGLKLGFKAGKPLVLSVIMNNKYVINTDEITAKTGTAAKIKINTSLFARDQKAAKQQFQQTLIFTIEESETLKKDFKGCFFNPNKEYKTNSQPDTKEAEKQP